MNTSPVSRREALRAAAVLGAASLITGPEALAAAPPAVRPTTGKTPALSPTDIAAIDAAMGKKGV